MKKLPLPLPKISIISSLVFLVVMMAILAGYYHSLLESNIRKNKYTQAKLQQKVEQLEMELQEERL